MNSTQKFLKELYKQNLQVLKNIKEQFANCGGDVNTLDGDECNLNTHYINDKGECVPKNDPVDEDNG